MTQPSTSKLGTCPIQIQTRNSSGCKVHKHFIHQLSLTINNLKLGVRLLRALVAYSIDLHRRGQWRADGNVSGANEKAPVLTGENGGGGGSRTRVGRFSNTVIACDFWV